MPLRTGQPNFSKGELAEDLISRVDVAAYATGLRRARNVMILKYGGITKRPGTRFVAEVYTDRKIEATFSGSITDTVLTVVENAVTPPVVTGVAVGQTVTGAGVAAGTIVTGMLTGAGGAGTYSVSIAQTVAETAMANTTPAPVRLMPFQFSLSQTYALEMGQGYMRAAALGGMVVEEKLTIEAITLGTTTMIRAAYHGYAMGDQVYLSGIEGTTALNGRIGRVLSVAGDDFVVDIDSTGFDAFTGDTGGAPPRVGAPPPPPPPPPVPPPPPPPPPPDIGGGGGGGGFCVADDTPILMADGSEIEARLLKVGMLVRTRHEDGLAWGDFPVEAIEAAWQPVLRTTIGDATIRATAEHRFWIDGAWVRMDAIGEPDGMVWVAKIAVADAHTYVSAGVLSHNKLAYDPNPDRPI